MARHLLVTWWRLSDDNFWCFVPFCRLTTDDWRRRCLLLSVNVFTDRWRYNSIVCVVSSKIALRYDDKFEPPEACVLLYTWAPLKRSLRIHNAVTDTSTSYGRRVWLLLLKNWTEDTDLLPTKRMSENCHKNTTTTIIRCKWSVVIFVRLSK